MFEPTHQNTNQSSHENEGNVLQAKSASPPAFSIAASPMQQTSDASGGCSLCEPMQLTALSSFPEGTSEEQMMGGGNNKDGQPVQRKADNSAGGSGGDSPMQLTAAGSGPLQLRGGATVGTLCVKTNVVNEGLTAGHAWLSYTPVSGGEETYGTWGNRTPIGLHRNIEVGMGGKATRCTEIDATDKANLDSFASSNNDWGLFNNCSSFAARGWLAVTGEHLNYTSAGIPNPSKLGESIIAAGGTLSPSGTGGSSDSSGSSYGSSSANSSVTSSYNSSM